MPQQAHKGYERRHLRRNEHIVAIIYPAGFFAAVKAWREFLNAAGLVELLNEFVVLVGCVKKREIAESEIFQMRGDPGPAFD
jgi:hypothetical protein